MGHQMELEDVVKLFSCESLKEWKTGFSIKCPASTTVVYTAKEGRPVSLHHAIKVKRSITCFECVNYSEGYDPNPSGSLMIQNLSHYGIKLSKEKECLKE